MAILVGLIAPQFVKYIEQSREAKDLECIDKMKGAIEAYASEHEQRGVHKVIADGSTIRYSLGDGVANGLLEYGIDNAVQQSSSNKIILEWDYDDFSWELVSDSCAGYYNAKGERIL